MPTWLEIASDRDLNSWSVVLVRGLLALMAGSIVARVFRSSQGEPANGLTSFPATLVLLSVLIALATQVIGDNVARAFGLAGALSVVRFRTVVRDTMDTAFVIFAVVVGMAMGAGQPLVAMIGLAIASLAVAMNRINSSNGTNAPIASVLKVKAAWSELFDTELRRLLADVTNGEVRLLGAATARQRTGMELTYELSLPPDLNLATLLYKIDGLDGIISTEITKSPVES